MNGKPVAENLSLDLLRRRIALLEAQRDIDQRSLYLAELKIGSYEELLGKVYRGFGLTFVPYDPAAEDARALEALATADELVVAP